MKSYSISYLCDEGYQSELRIQAPRLRVPFGKTDAADFTSKSGDDKAKNGANDGPETEREKKVYFDTSLNVRPEHDKNQIVARFKKFLLDIDQFILTYVFDKNEELFTAGSKKKIKSLKSNIEEFFFYPSVRQNPDKTDTTKIYENFKIRLPIINKKDTGQKIPMFKVYLPDNKELIITKDENADEGKIKSTIDWGWTSRGMDIYPIIKCDGFIHITAGEKISVSWSAIAVIPYTVDKNKITENSFVKLDDDEELSTPLSGLKIDDKQSNEAGSDGEKSAEAAATDDADADADADDLINEEEALVDPEED